MWLMLLVRLQRGGHGLMRELTEAEGRSSRRPNRQGLSAFQRRFQPIARVRVRPKIAMCKRLTFSLRAMLVAVAAIACALGWYAARVRPQQAAVDAIFDCGGSVFYALPNGGVAGWDGSDGTRIRTLVAHSSGSSHFWRDFYDEVLQVDFHKMPVDDAICRHLACLPKLRRLSLGSNPISDVGAAHLAGLYELRTLVLDKTEIGDSTLRHLKGLKKLTCLLLDETNITDDGLRSLYGLRQLDTLTLIETETSEEARAQLREALPQCNVIF